jgi:hypothetical protein
MIVFVSILLLQFICMLPVVSVRVSFLDRLLWECAYRPTGPVHELSDALVTVMLSMKAPDFLRAKDNHPSVGLILNDDRSKIPKSYVQQELVTHLGHGDASFRKAKSILKDLRHVNDRSTWVRMHMIQNGSLVVTTRGPRTKLFGFIYLLSPCRILRKTDTELAFTTLEGI